MPRIPSRLGRPQPAVATRSVLLTLLVLLCGGLSVQPARAEAEPPDWRDWVPPHGFGRGRLGVEIQPMTPELRTFLKAPSDRGVLVVRVRPDSPAAAAELRVGDVITSANGDPVERPSDLIAGLGQLPTGEDMELGIVREGAEHAISVIPEGEPGGWAGAEPLEEWLGSIGRGPHHRRELEKRLEALEERIDELERRLEGTAGPKGKST